MGQINNSFIGGQQCVNDNDTIVPIELLPSQTGDCCPINQVSTGNSFVTSSRRIDTIAPLFGGGDFSINRTHFMPPATDFQDGYMTAADHQLLGLNNAYKVLYGYAVWSGVGLTYNITTCIYRINGITYTTLPTTVTLNPNPVSNRIDVIFLSTSQTVGVLTGIPTINPIKPLVNFSTQIELTFVNLTAGGTIPLNAGTKIQIYDENVEWNTVTNAQIDFQSVSTPYTGIKAVLHSDGITYAQYNATSIVNVLDVEFLVFYLRIPVNYINPPTALILGIGFETYNGVSSNSYGTFQVTALHGFDATLYDVYQRIEISMIDIPNAGIGTITNFYIKAVSDTFFTVDNIYLLTRKKANANSNSKIYHVISASFFDATNYYNPDMIGKNLAIFHQGINRYLESNEWSATSQGFNVLLDDFDATRDIYSMFVTTNLIEA